MPILGASWGEHVVERCALRVQYIEEVVPREVDFNALFVVEALTSHFTYPDILFAYDSLFVFDPDALLIASTPVASIKGKSSTGYMLL